MTKFSQGENVAANTDLSLGVFTTIPQGERGVVRKVEEGFITAPSYLVKFFSGSEEWVDEKYLNPA